MEYHGTVDVYRSDDGSGDIIVKEFLPQSKIQDMLDRSEAGLDLVNENYISASPTGNRAIQLLVAYIVYRLKKIAKRMASGLLITTGATLAVGAGAITLILEANGVVLKELLKQCDEDNPGIYMLIYNKYNGYDRAGSGIPEYKPYKIEFENIYGTTSKSQFSYRPGSSYPSV